MEVSIRQMRNFLAVANALHFRRAADTLNLAQPALSRSIRDLEIELGVTLFHRTRRSVELTDAGATLVEEWGGILERIDRGAERARAAARGQIGMIRIAYTDFAIAGVLPGLIQAFATVAPEVEIETRHLVTWRQIAALEQGEIDVGFVTGPIEDAELETVPVMKERCVLVVPRSHRLAGATTVALCDLSTEDFVLGDDTDWRNFHAYIYSECHRAGFVPRVRQRAYNTIGIFGLVAAGMGITFHSETARNMMHPDLTVVPITDFRPEIPTLAVWPRQQSAPAVETFTRFLTEQAAGLMP
ncbi:MAG: LysR family transcriptional regulator [Pseudomonadota bacterium]